MEEIRIVLTYLLAIPILLLLWWRGILWVFEQLEESNIEGYAPGKRYSSWEDMTEEEQIQADEAIKQLCLLDNYAMIENILGREEADEFEKQVYKLHSGGVDFWQAMKEVMKDYRNMNSEFTEYEEGRHYEYRERGDGWEVRTDKGRKEKA